MRTIRRILLPAGLFALISATALPNTVSASTTYNVSDLFYNGGNSWNYFNTSSWYLEADSQETLSSALLNIYETEYLYSLYRTEQQFYSLDAEAGYSYMPGSFELSHITLQ